jgi:transposase
MSMVKSSISSSLSGGVKREGHEPPTAAGAENGPPKSSSEAPEKKAVDPALAASSAEVLARPERRRFSKEYKLRILQEVERCPAGQIGALLRREGIYSSNLTRWRKKRDQGALVALTPKKRGPPSTVNPLAKRVAEVERECTRLQGRLAQAEAIIDIQKKVAALLGIPLKTLPAGDGE